VDGVGAGATDHEIVSEAPGHLVGSRSAEGFVVAAPSQQGVLTVGADEDVRLVIPDAGHRQGHPACQNQG
jgi:hypothetical protein